MTEPTLLLQGLGERVSRSQEAWVRGLGPLTYDPGVVRARRRTRERWVLGGCCLAGAAAAAALLLFTHPRALRYEASGVVAQGPEQGQTWSAPLREGRLEFSDGSNVVVKESGSVRVRELRSNGAVIELEHGSVKAHIAHRANTSWAFHAGPYVVAIVGTAFDMDWSDRGRTLSLIVEEGAVRVSGCSVSALKITTGQAMTLRCPAVELTQATSAAPPGNVTQAPETQERPIPSTSPRQEPAASASAASPPSASAAPAAPDWRALLAAGSLREAYAAADSVGFESECDHAAATELLELANAAAVAGRADRARVAWLTVRRRFPGTQAAAMSAYKLAALASDRAGASGDARAWLEVYLREAPSGGLAREALGRLLEIEVRTGNTASAKTRAEQYVRQYPDGPQAALARKVLAP
jgi:TolA-binding protein